MVYYAVLLPKLRKPDAALLVPIKIQGLSSTLSPELNECP